MPPPGLSTDDEPAQIQPRVTRKPKQKKNLRQKWALYSTQSGLQGQLHFFFLRIRHYDKSRGTLNPWHSFCSATWHCGTGNSSRVARRAAHSQLGLFLVLFVNLRQKLQNIKSTKSNKNASSELFSRSQLVQLNCRASKKEKWTKASVDAQECIGKLALRKWFLYSRSSQSQFYVHK